MKEVKVLLGKLTVNTTGDLTVGKGDSRLEIGASGTPGTAEFTSGTVNIKGRLTVTNGTASITGAVISIDPQDSLQPGWLTLHVFEAVWAASVTMSGGSITIIDPISVSNTWGREIQLVSVTVLKYLLWRYYLSGRWVV